MSLYAPLSQALHRKKDIDTYARMFGRTLSASDERTLQRLIHANDPVRPATAASDSP